MNQNQKAALLSGLVYPGLGQLKKKQTAKGIAIVILITFDVLWLFGNGAGLEYRDRTRPGWHTDRENGPRDLRSPPPPGLGSELVAGRHFRGDLDLRDRGCSALPSRSLNQAEHLFRPAVFAGIME